VTITYHSDTDLEQEYHHDQSKGAQKFVQSGMDMFVFFLTLVP
jgi:hypothetical protein